MNELYVIKFPTYWVNIRAVPSLAIVKKWSDRLYLWEDGTVISDNYLYGADIWKLGQKISEPVTGEM